VLMIMKHMMMKKEGTSEVQKKAHLCLSKAFP